MMSHSPAVVRQIADAEASTSAGQALDEPSHVSTISQPPALARQVVVIFASRGHVVFLPLQKSASSQTPAEARHTVLNDSSSQYAEQQSPFTVLPSSQASSPQTFPSPHSGDSSMVIVKLFVSTLFSASVAV
jgi:hypothetical protein